MNNNTLTQTATQVANFTFRSSWLQAINRIRAKSTRSRLLQAIVNYTFTHQFTLTGNSTIDSLMTIIADQIDTQLNRPNNFQEPEPESKPKPISQPIPQQVPEPVSEPILQPIQQVRLVRPVQSTLPHHPHRPPKNKPFQRIPIYKILQRPNRSRQILHPTFR